MQGHSEEEVKRQVTVYIRVFLALAVLTVLTVGVSYLKMPIALAVLVALIVATIKSSLVAAFFMHLSAEKRIIYGVLLITVFFFFFVLLIPALHSL